MKNIFRVLFLAMPTILLFTACDKKQDLTSYKNGNAVVLSSSAAVIAPAPVDSNNVGATFSWTNPQYGQDASLYKFILQIDSAGKDFSKGYQKVITGALDTAMSNRELNAIALGFGFAFNTAYDMDVRVISSYGNNNEQYISNTVTIKYTPYKVPPKIALPASGKLFLVGDASQGGWGNPVPVPSQEFSRIDETTFAGVFSLIGGKHYLALPENGSWDHKYNISDAAFPAAGGDFGYDQPKDFNGPATDGLYTITLDFQTGKYSVVPYTGTFSGSLVITGEAAGGWNNPVPPTQEFTRLNSSEFTLTLPLVGDKQYLLLPVNGDWAVKFGSACGSDGCNNPSGDDFKEGGGNLKAPAASGTYTIHVNFVTSKFTAQ